MTLPSPPHWDADTDGTFPFGRPNTPRPVREPEAGKIRQLVIGVYPSALHVAWTRSASAGLPTAKRRVASMAVDVEPTVFWNGQHPSVTEEVDRWIGEVGFRSGTDPSDHGTLGPAMNGPSGDTLDEYFDVLPIGQDETAFLDVYPVYLVKRAARPRTSTSRRQQGDAIDDVYNDFLATLAPGPGGAWSPSRLPTRPTGTHGVAPAAVERFGAWLCNVLLAAEPERVVTLGQEPWTALARLPGIDIAHPSPALSPDPTHYGAEGTITIEGRHIPWTPLAHPGLLHHGNATKPGTWAHVHHRWISTSTR